MNMLEWLMRKDAPAAADVHVSSTGQRKRPKAPAETKLPVTGATLAAQAENPEDDPMKKGIGPDGRAHLIQTMHDHACALGACCNGDPGEDDADDVGKGGQSWEIPFKVAKADADQGLIFGWASVVEKNGVLVIDKQGDAILPEDLEKAAYDFVLNARNHGEMHSLIGTGKCIESMMFTKAKQDALGIDLGQVGWWVGFAVSDTETRAAIKRGELPEFSIGGSGRRVEME